MNTLTKGLSMFCKKSETTTLSWKDVTPAELQRWIHEGRAPRLVDVRETSELAGELGHIAGVDHVPLAAVASACTTWPRSEPVLVICRSGGRSSKAAGILAGLGFTHVHNLAGGMQAWNAAGLPISRAGR